MKTGVAGHAAAVQHEAEMTAWREERGQTFRFFLKDKEEARITFIDGDLVESPAGMILGPPRFYEHSLFENGVARHFVCPAKNDPGQGHVCPICESGDRAALVSIFTIIDHRQYKDKNGNVRSNTRKLFVAKPLTMEVLTKTAIKRGGLAGCTYDVSRLGENAPAVGNVFEFVEKNPIEVLQPAFMHEQKIEGQPPKQVTYFLPADYEKEFIFRTPEELQKLGLGKPTPYKGPSTSAQAAPKTDYASKL
jgi:hypothetical protein